MTCKQCGPVEGIKFLFACKYFINTLPLATQQYIKGIKDAAFPDACLLGPNNINNTNSHFGVIGYGQKPIAALINCYFANKIWYI